MSRAEEYYSNFGRWSIEEYVAEYVLKNPLEMGRFNAILENIPHNVSTLLDIGCGPGVFLHRLEEQRGIKGIGIEITDRKIKYAQDILSVNVLKGNARHLPFRAEAFEVVTALELIEHLPYDVYEETVEEIQRVSKKWIIISVPYCENRAYVTCPYCGAKFNPNYHLRSFDEERVKKIFSDFKMVKLEKAGVSFQLPQFFEKISGRLLKQTFPEFAVCPACGYRNPVEGDIALQKTTPSLTMQLLRRGSICLKKRKRYSHLIVFYERRIG